MRSLPNACVSSLLLALLLTGCGGSPLASPATPSLDCAAPFPELSSSRAEPAPGIETSPEESPSAGSVSLAGRFAADLLEDGQGGGWRLFQDETLTVLTHNSGSDVPDALIYAETFSRVAQDRPGEEMRRFLLTIDPTLTQRDAPWGSAPITVAATLGNGNPADHERLARATGLAMTRTGGRGLGYSSEPGSFSGWKWIGQNSQGVFLRLARSQGNWGVQGPLDPALYASMDRLIQKFPQLDWMKSGWPISGGTVSASRSPVPASMVLGSASTPEGGVHLALLCARTPSCGSAPELARFLSSLRPISADDIAAAGDALPPEDLEIEAGLVVARQSGVLSPSSSTAVP